MIELQLSLWAGIAATILEVIYSGVIVHWDYEIQKMTESLNSPWDIISGIIIFGQVLIGVVIGLLIFAVTAAIAMIYATHVGPGVLQWIMESLRFHITIVN